MPVAMRRRTNGIQTFEGTTKIRLMIGNRPSIILIITLLPPRKMTLFNEVDAC
jgi:hypothetical protein